MKSDTRNIISLIIIISSSSAGRGFYIIHSGLTNPRDSGDPSVFFIQFVSERIARFATVCNLQQQPEARHSFPLAPVSLRNCCPVSSENNSPSLMLLASFTTRTTLENSWLCELVTDFLRIGDCVSHRPTF